MLKEAEKTFKAIEDLHNNRITSHISQGTLDEHKKNIEDLKKLLSEYNELLDLLVKQGLDRNTLGDILVKIHAKLIALSWHAEQLDELVIECIKGLPERPTKA